MSSERRIRASRENGALSNGPKTPEGKLRSSQNNFRHGILAQTIVLGDEDGDAFNELLGSLEDELDPRTPNEAALVETMAVTRWRLMRIWALETEGLRLEIEKHDPALHGPPARAALAFRSLRDDSRSLDTLHRYETRCDRQYARVLRLLWKAQSSNLPYEPSPKNEHPAPPELGKQ